jgi:threonine/homoserine/homoserine lactone efflux protein
MGFLLKGLILGFSIAAPVGPIGLLCIRRTLAEGQLSGFVSGLGAATADAFYGFIAAFGLTAISSLFLNFELPIKIIGGLFLFYLAAKISFSKPAEKAAKGDTNTSLFKAYLSTVFLTITNPSTIISFIAVFAGLGIGVSAHDYSGATFTVLGVFCGSILWWLILSTFVGLFKHKFSHINMIWVNRISGVLMAGLGVISFLK